MKIKVYIIDDHPMVIEGVKSLLSDSEKIEVVGSATDGYVALEKLIENRADIILVDINLNDMNGIDLCRILKEKFPQVKVLGLSTFKERSYITRMIEAGASGYLLKNAAKDEIEEAVDLAYRGKLYLSMEVTEIITKPTSLQNNTVPLLTSREKEVLQLIAEGLTNNDIAAQLFISPLTVDSHRKNLLAKFGVKNTAAMIKYALDFGLL